MHPTTVLDPRPKVATLMTSRPEVMTGRARLLLATVAARNIAIGWFFTLRPELFVSPSFDVLRATAALPTWGAFLLVIGTTCGAAAVGMRERIARVGISCSTIATGVLASGFAYAWLADRGASPMGLILCASLTAKDAIICAQPMRSPWEPVLRQLAGRPRGD